MTLDLSGIGERIAYYRKLNGWTADDLAAKTEGQVSRSVLANIESGRKKDVTVTQAAQISVALQVPLVALLFDIKQPHAPTGVELLYAGPNSVKPYSQQQLWEWFGGREFGFNPQWPKARQEVREVLDQLASLSRIDNEIGARLLQIHAYRNARAHGEELDSIDADTLALFEKSLEESRAAEAMVRQRLSSLGVELDG